ncbi:hypothetical protein PsorP6_011190 [Peronosclerospora sorghi]|uniref:Uncharacterized protein n=1 Tax=Peronosclerospora sorghi TaxID=230839 RepID=A0ACC0VXN4_9STRA|nr:hypothetical protein PsorP6_011190 [Peronosclerospora sorghi]
MANRRGLEPAASFDPLPALEDEYAAVVAQSRPLAEKMSSFMQFHDAESASNNSADAERGVAEGYMLLPCSPCASEDEAIETMPDEADTVKKRATCVYTESETWTDDRRLPVQHKHIPLEENTRVAIRESMRNVKLQPPPWAATNKLTDDELVTLVQTQLALRRNNT